MSVPLEVPGTHKGTADLDVCNGISVVNWQPGNGTWYRLLFTPLEPHMRRALGFDLSDPAFLVTWIVPGEPGYSYVFSKNEQFLAYWYVQEKLCHKRGSEVDASELTRIIALMLQRETRLCTDEKGRFIDGR